MWREGEREGICLELCWGSPADSVRVGKGNRLGGGRSESLESQNRLPACLGAVRTGAAPAGLCAEGRAPEGQGSS